MLFRTQYILVGALLLTSLAVLAPAQEKRELIFAEKVAPIVRKQLEINYPNDPEMRDNLYSTWKVANGMKLTAEENAARFLQQSPQQTSKNAELHGALNELAQIKARENELIPNIDRLTRELDQSQSPESGTSSGGGKPFVNVKKEEPPGNDGQEPPKTGSSDLAPVFSGWSLTKVKTDLESSTAFQQLSSIKKAIDAIGKIGEVATFVQTLSKIDGARLRVDLDLKPDGTNFFFSLKYLADVQVRIRKHNTLKPSIGDSPKERNQFDLDADDLNEELRRYLRELGDDTAEFDNPPPEPSAPNAAQRIRDLLNRSNSQRSTGGGICPPDQFTPPSSTKPRKVLN